MKKLIVFIFLAITSMKGFGQLTFQKTYGPSSCSNFQITGDGGYLLSGSYSNDWYIVKTDSAGNVLWTRIFESPGTDRATFIQPTSDNNYIVSGYMAYGAGGMDFGLVKIDSTGNIIWAHTYGGVNDEGYSLGDKGVNVCQTSDGGYAAAGITLSFGAGGKDIYVVRTDANGDTVWTRSYGEAMDEYGKYIVAADDGGFIIGGTTLSFSTTVQGLIIKTDSLGQIEWSRTYGSSLGIGLISIRQTSDGGYIACGSISSDILVLKIDSSGNVQWAKNYGGPYQDNGNDIEETSDGYLVAGLFDQSYATSYYHGYECLIKLDRNGDAVWSRRYWSYWEDYAINCAYAVHDAGDGYVLAGNGASETSEQMHLIKTDLNGNTACQMSNPNYGATTTVVTQASVACLTSRVNTILGTPSFNLNSGATPNTICSSIGVAENEINKDVICFPNPSGNSFQIRISDQLPEINFSLNITDAQGKIVYSAEIHGREKAITCNLNPGVYFIKLSGEKMLYTQKLVIQ